MRAIRALDTAAAIALLASASAPSHAQDGSGALGRTPQERREQLAKVQEQLGDPDPLMRLAYMEDLMASGDALRMQIAMRTAFASDDPDLRGIALRAYLASHREFTFDVILPANMQKLVDSTAPATRQEIDKQYPFVQKLTDYAFKVHLKVTDYRMGENVGKIAANAQEANFTITGDVLSTFVPLAYVANCYVDFWPTRKQTLEGKLACGGVWPKLDISTRAF